MDPARNQPTLYAYADPIGRTYLITSGGQLQSIQDLNGNTLTVTSTGITSSVNGVVVPFVRDPNTGNITKITDLNGNVIGWSSAGKVGFKGSRKSTAYAAQLVAQDACRQAMGHGLKEVEVLVKGPGAGRESAVRAIQAIGLDISVIRDVTPVPHNGCRPPKQRRV